MEKTSASSVNKKNSSLTESAAYLGEHNMVVKSNKINVGIKKKVVGILFITYGTVNLSKVYLQDLFSDH